MAVTQNTYTGNGSTVLYSFTFPYLETTNIKVSLNGTVTTAYTLANATTVQFNTAPANGTAIRIYRDTDDSGLTATFYPGSAIRSQDLNENFTQNLYVTQEVNNNAVNIDGSNPMVGDLNMGGYKVTNLATPVVGTDAANRSFVEGVFSSEVPVFYRRWSKTAAGGETSLSGNDDNGIALSYVPGSEKVFINGALQIRGVDYLGTTGSTLTGIPALTAGDIIEVHSSSSYTVGTVPDGSVTNAKVDGAAAIQSTKLAFIQAGTGAVTRTVESKLRDVVSVKDFGAVGDGVTDDRAAIQSAVTAASYIYFPPGTYRLREAIFIEESNVKLFGAGTGVTTIRMDDSPTNSNYSAIDIRTSRANSGSGGSISNVTISDLTINGNKAGRITTSGNCIIALCNTSHTIDNLSITNVRTQNSPGAGILLEGLANGTNDSYKIENTLIDCCNVVDNNGVGISQFKVNNTTIVNSALARNGLENLTIDVYSQACIVDGNRFFRHLGGTGNIGIDSGDACVISNNFIDNELSTSASPGFRTGIALNSQLTGGGGSRDLTITGNVILNCSDYGIYAHDDTGGSFGSHGGFTFNGEAGGNAVITSNHFAGNGTDVRIENCVGPTIIKANRLSTLTVTDPGISDVRVGSGDIVFDAFLSGNQTIAITAGSAAWKQINLGGLNGRLATVSSNALILPVGGYYQFNVKARIEGLSALDVDYMSVGIGHTPTGGSETIFALINVDPNIGAGTAINSTTELTLPYGAFLAAGTIRLYVRAQTANSGNLTIRAGADTRLTGFCVG
jgi:polygalacturonase